MAAPPRKRRLGKGLSSLLTQPVEVRPPIEHQPATAEESSNKPSLVRDEHEPTGPRKAKKTKNAAQDEPIPSGEGLVYVLIEQITPNPNQPRQVFDDDGIASLADSISKAGLMQPVVLRKSKTADMFELVAGERRWRAAQVAGLQQLPALIRDLDDKTSAEWALIENLQREDLNPIDRAEAFDRLVVDFEVTHAEIAAQLGIDRTSVTNFLRLNDLETSAKDAVRDGRLSMGHAKVLLGIPEVTTCKAIARRCAAEQWSVRELERQLKKLSKKQPTSTSTPDPMSMHMDNLGAQLSEHLGTQVSISLGKKKGSGKVSISFYTNEQFEGILDTIHFKPAS